MSLGDIQALVNALSTGLLPMPLTEGSALHVESLEATMSVVTFLDIPTRRVDGRLQPVLDVYGKYYEFHYVNGRWEQVPSWFTAKHPTVRGMLRNRRINVKRLTPYMMRKVRRRLNAYTSFLNRETGEWL